MTHGLSIRAPVISFSLSVLLNHTLTTLCILTQPALSKGTVSTMEIGPAAPIITTLLAFL